MWAIRRSAPAMRLRQAAVTPHTAIAQFANGLQDNAVKGRFTWLF